MKIAFHHVCVITGFVLGVSCVWTFIQNYFMYDSIYWFVLLKYFSTLSLYPLSPQLRPFSFLHVAPGFGQCAVSFGSGVCFLHRLVGWFVILVCFLPEVQFKLPYYAIKDSDSFVLSWTNCCRKTLKNTPNIVLFISHQWSFLVGFAPAGAFWSDADQRWSSSQDAHCSFTLLPAGSFVWKFLML